MIYSMTGFASNASENSTFTVEMKSVNNKYLDVNLKLPESIRHLELQIREKISKSILRGKIDLQITRNNSVKDSKAVVSEGIATQINDAYLHIKNFIPKLEAPSFKEVIELSQTFKSKESEELEDATILNQIDEILSQFLQSRAREGQRLANVMLEYVEEIEKIHEQIRAKLPELTKEINEKLTVKIQNIMEELNPKGLEGLSKEEINSRIALEVATMLVKGNINEELDRITSHSKEIRSILSEDSALRANQSKGKRLDFIYQEMNREINTIGSKSSDTSITNHVIDLKVLVDQLREQSLNLE